MTKTELEAKKEELEEELREVRKILYNYDFEEKKVKYGDKYTCEFCKFNAVHDLSGDGWHNTCGADNCTCCHAVCEKYEPDNDITLFIKQNINTDRLAGFGRCENTNGYGHISEDKYRAIEELAGDIFNPRDRAEKIIALLKVCFNITESKAV